MNWKLALNSNGRKTSKPFSVDNFRIYKVKWNLHTVPLFLSFLVYYDELWIERFRMSYRCVLQHDFVQSMHGYCFIVWLPIVVTSFSNSNWIA